MHIRWMGTANSQGLCTFDVREVPDCGSTGYLRPYRDSEEIFLAAAKHFTQFEQVIKVRALT